MLSTYNNYVILNLMTVNGSEEEITIKLNMGVLQTLLETTANDLLKVFKASRQVPEQSDDEMRGKILRELYDMKEALMGSKQHASVVIDLTQDSEQEDSESEIFYERSPKVSQKRSHEESHLSSPPAKRVCSTPMGNSKIPVCFNNTAGSSNANSQDADDASSKSISESVVCTSQQHTVMDLSQIFSLNSTSKTTPSGNTSADMTCGNFQAKQNESIPSTSSRLASPSGKSTSVSNKSSVPFKRSCSKAAGSSKSRQRSNQEPANVPNKRNTTQGVQQANSKCDESSNGPQPTGNTTTSEKCATGPSYKTCTGIILLSEKASTSEASTKQNIIDSQDSAMHDPKQSQASTSHGLPLSVSPTKGKGTGGKDSSKSTKRPSKKESNQENSSESADRKRGSRCPISMRRLCPVCSKQDCGKCKNCL